MDALENLRDSIARLPAGRVRRALDRALACELECLVSKVESLFYRYVIDKDAPISELEAEYVQDQELFGQFLVWYFTRGSENV